MQDQKVFHFVLISIFVLVSFAILYICTDDPNRPGNGTLGDTLNSSQDLNSEIKDGIERAEQQVGGIEREVDSAIQGVGRAETELERAERSIENCQQIIGRAKRRTQETDSQVK